MSPATRVGVRSAPGSCRLLKPVTVSNVQFVSPMKTFTEISLSPSVDRFSIRKIPTPGLASCTSNSGGVGRMTRTESVTAPNAGIVPLTVMVLVPIDRGTSAMVQFVATGMVPLAPAGSFVQARSPVRSAVAVPSRFTLETAGATSARSAGKVMTRGGGKNAARHPRGTPSPTVSERT